MRIIKSLIAICIYSAYLSSCTEEKAKNQPMDLLVSPTNQINTVIIDIKNESSIIPIYGETEFEIDFPKSKEVISTEFFFNDNEIGSIKDKNKFNLNSNLYDDGVYKLFIKYEYTNRNGPVNEQHGIEIISDTTSVNIEVYNRPPDAIKITEHKPSNGLLKLSWPKYTGPDFQSYSVYEKIYKNLYEQEILAQTMYSVDSTSWHNPAYVGGKRTFRVDITAKDETIVGIDTTFFYEQQFTNINLTQDSLAKLEWPYSPFYNALKSYKIYRAFGENVQRGTDENFWSWEEIQEIEDISINSYIDKDFGFGTIAAYKVLYQSKVIYVPDVFYSSYYIKHQLFFLGKEGWFFSWLHHNPKAGRIYLVDEYTYVLSEDNLEEIRIAHTHPLTFTMSLDNSIGFMRRSDHVFGKINPDNLTYYYGQDVRDYIGYDSVIGSIACNSNGLLFYSGMIYESPTFYSDRFFVLDPESSKLVSVIGNGKLTPWPLIEVPYASGNYLLLSYNHSRGIYEFVQDTLIFRAPVKNKDQFCFNPTGHTYFYASEESITEYDLETNQIIRTIPIQNTLNKLSVINNNKSISGYTNDGYYLIYSLTTGQLQKKIKLFSPIYGAYYYCNNNIFSTAGYYMSIK